MIQWLRAKTNPIPTNYECLFLLDTGKIVVGLYQPDMSVIGWTVANRPDWLNNSNSHHKGYCSGEAHPKSKLSDKDCENIRELYGEPGQGLTYQQIADKYETSKSTIRDIVKFRTRR